MTPNMDSGLRRGWMLLILVAGLTLDSGNNQEADERPYFISEPSHTSVLVGSAVTLPCKVENIGKSVLIWKRSRGGILFSGPIRVVRDSRLSLVEGSKLQIDLVTPEYAGEYICEVDGHPDLKLHHRIQVLVPPSITTDPEDGRVVVEKGDPVSLHCKTAGFPAPVVTWTFLNGVLPGGVPRKQGPVLSISSADPMHTGIYECDANNDVGESAKATFKLRVLYSPVLLVRPEWAHGGEGMTLDFTCTSSAEPPATLRWTRRDGSPLPDDGHFSSSFAPHSRSVLNLHIRKMLSEHLGAYMCTANNSVGVNWKTVEVSGLAEPVLFRNNATGEFESSFLLLWTVKSFTAVSEYLLRIRKHKSAEHWIEVTIPAVEDHGQSLLHSHAYNVTGLEPGMKYEAVLQAMNNAGWNRPSETFVFQTKPDPDLENEENTEISHFTIYNIEDNITDSTMSTSTEDADKKPEEIKDENDIEQAQTSNASSQSFTQVERTIILSLCILMVLGLAN